MELADINRREILRYLGYKNQEADEHINRIVKTAWSFCGKMFRLNTGYGNFHLLLEKIT